MGQYYKGDKIGTCESMYYMRLETAQRLAGQGEKDDDGIKFSEYLADNQTKWRFPFPDEDKGLKHPMKFDKGFDLPSGDIEVLHDNLYFTSQHANGGYQFGIKIPCPHSKEFDRKLLNSCRPLTPQFLTVRFQAMRDGKEKTVFACARCGNLQRFSDEDVEKIRKAATEHFSAYRKPNDDDNGIYNYAIEIINRIK